MEQEFTSVNILDKKFPSHQPALAFRAKNLPEWEDWREKLITELKNLFFIGMPAEPSPLKPLYLSQTDGETYIQHKVAYQSQPGVLAPAYLLIPKGERKPRPAVLCVHGHVPRGKEGVVTQQYSVGMPYAAELAKRGFVTLAPDNAGMGERSRGEGSDCELLWRRLNYLGKDVTGYRVYDLVRGLDFLLGLDEVDNERVGCVGLSLGCWLSIVLSALDKKAAVLSGYFTTFAQTSWQGHCICHHPFGIGKICEMPDIASLIAPRPIFVEFGADDLSRPVQPAFSMTQKVYELLGVPENIQLDIFDGEHLFNGKKSLLWLENILNQEGKNRIARNEYKPFKIV